MNRYTALLQRNLKASIEAKNRLSEDAKVLESFEKAVDAVVKVYQNGGKIFIAGNGGSAADAQHLSAEFVSKLARPRRPLPAEALTVDTSILTAIGNDFGFDEVFSRQIEGKMGKNDIFLGITTSGKSKNIIKALQKCRELGFQSILLSAKDGGEAKNLADFCILVPGEWTSTIQELHLVVYHTLCESVEVALFPE